MSERTKDTIWTIAGWVLGLAAIWLAASGGHR